MLDSRSAPAFFACYKAAQCLFFRCGMVRLRTSDSGQSAQAIQGQRLSCDVVVGLPNSAVFASVDLLCLLKTLSDQPQLLRPPNTAVTNQLLRLPRHAMFWRIGALVFAAERFEGCRYTWARANVSKVGCAIATCFIHPQPLWGLRCEHVCRSLETTRGSFGALGTLGYTFVGVP
jgi:hypothetical protein